MSRPALRGRPAGALVLALALLPALAPGPGASAATTGRSAAGSEDRISGVAVVDGELEVRLSSPVLATAGGVEPGDVAVELVQDDGRAVPLPVSDVAPVTEAGAGRQAVVLVVDTSGSMGDANVEVATGIATEFADRLDPAVEVGVATFVGGGTTAVELTTDRDAARRALADLPPAEDSFLYGAVGEALDDLAGLPEGSSRRLVVVADGGDGSPASERDPTGTARIAGAAVVERGVTLTTVSFRSELGEQRARQDYESLLTFTEAAGGRFAEATDPAGVSRALDEVATAIATEVVVTAELPPEVLGATGTLAVTVAGEAGSVTATLATMLGTAPEEPPRPAQGAGPPLPPGLTQVLGLVLVGVALALLVAVVLGAADPAPDPAAARRRQLAAYTLTGGGPVRPAGPGPVAGSVPAATETRLGDNVLARSAVEVAGRLVRGRTAGERLGRALEAAGLPLRPEEWLVVHAGVTVAAGVLLLLVSGGHGAALALGLVLGLAIPALVLGVRRTRRERAFAELLPDTLALLASGLRAGFSLQQAIDSVARESRNPVRGEFTRAMAESQLGLPPEDALQGVADRIASRDFAWVVLAVRIQRQVGGNLAELLDTVAATVRERARLRRQVLVLSAEGRLSAWIIAALPLVFTAYLMVVRPAYLAPLVTTPLGLLSLVAAGVLFGLGLLGLRWATKVVV